MTLSPTQTFESYVALGDSSTEGIDDPDGHGGYRGWSNRLAEKVAAAQGSLLYANLGVRGRHTRQIREQQLPRALALNPDLVTLFSGTNDVVSRAFDLAAVTRDIQIIQEALIGQGATLLTFTLPDLTQVLPTARRIAPRLLALNEALREVSEKTGALLVDFAEHAIAVDPRLWSHDRFHANAEGHERIAAALAHELGVAGSDDSWQLPLPPAPPQGAGHRIAGEVRWITGYLLPWLWRHARGRSSGDGRTCKRPDLESVASALHE